MDLKLFSRYCLATSEVDNWLLTKLSLTLVSKLLVNFDF